MNQYFDSQEFLDAFKGGDQIAFRKLFDATIGQITRMTSAKCGWAKPEEIEDFVAEAYCRVYPLREKYTDYNHIINSLTVIARNEAVSYERHRARQWHWENVWRSLLPDVEDHPAERYDRIAEVTEAISCLKPRLRVVVESALYDHKSMAEIANSFGLPPQTVYNRWNRAIQNIRELLSVKVLKSAPLSPAQKQSRYRARLRSVNFATI